MTIQEKWPWTVQEWGAGTLVLQAKDFSRDVSLVITGDFASQEDKRVYAEEMARRLNAPNLVE